MANYILVENRQTIHLGPIPWRHRFIQSELDDLEVNFKVSPSEMGYVRINDNFEIFPVGEPIGPEIDDRWEDPIGPTWAFNEEEIILPKPEFAPEELPAPSYWKREAIPTYSKSLKQIDQVKQFVKNDVASKRFFKEATGTQAEIRPEVFVTVDTSRDGRAIFVQVFSTMDENANVDWKFPEGWFSITKQELGVIISAGFTHIQSQFNWEKEYVDRIDATGSVDDLKLIYDEVNPVISPVINGE